MGHTLRARDDVVVRHEEHIARIRAAVEAHSPQLLAYFVRRVRQHADAADLLGETLLTLWRRASALPAHGSEIRPWMFGIARNVLLHHYRRSARQLAMTDKLRELLALEPHAGFADPTEHDELHRALAALNPIDREIIGLIHWEGLSQVEVGRVLRMKEGTVRSRYHRARVELRARLEAET